MNIFCKYNPGIMLEELEDNPEAVSARLKKVRGILGRTKKEFAEMAGMAEQTYGAFENGNRYLSLDGAKKIRKAHDLSLEFMYFGKIDDLPTRISKHL